MAKAIWQDTYITVPIQNSPLKYRIEIRSTGEWQDENGFVHNDPPAIFYGKAWANPTTQNYTDTIWDTFEDRLYEAIDEDVDAAFIQIFHYL